MAQALTLEEAAAAFGKPVRHIEEAARGPSYKHRDRLGVPERFEVRVRQVEAELDGRPVALTRRELWGDGRLLWAIESGAVR